MNVKLFSEDIKMKKNTLIMFVLIMLLSAGLMFSSTDVKITYVNNSSNTDHPAIFVFTKNMIPTFDVLKDGVAWKTMPDIGIGSSHVFTYPGKSFVRASGSDGSITNSLPANPGKKYTVKSEAGGLILMPNGMASESGAIEVSNEAQGAGIVNIQITKDGKVMMTKNIVAYGQKATFVLHPKLYWGVASDIQEGQIIGTADLLKDNFFEHDISGVNHAVVTITGNSKDGYKFKVEHKR